MFRHIKTAVKIIISVKVPTSSVSTDISIDEEIKCTNKILRVALKKVFRKVYYDSILAENNCYRYSFHVRSKGLTQENKDNLKSVLSTVELDNGQSIIFNYLDYIKNTVKQGSGISEKILPCNA